MDPPSYRTVQRRLRLYAGADTEASDGNDAVGPMQPESSRPVSRRLLMLLMARGGRGWRGRV